MDSVVAGKEVFGIGAAEIDSCQAQLKLLRQTATTMEETPKAAIAVIEALQVTTFSLRPSLPAKKFMNSERQDQSIK